MPPHLTSAHPLAVDLPLDVTAAWLESRRQGVRRTPRRRGCQSTDSAWTTNLIGYHWWRHVASFVTRKKWAPSLRDWKIAGANLFNHLCPAIVAPENWLPGCETHLWLHSHAGNVGFFACDLGLVANTFVTVCTPVREDMVPAIKRGRPRMGFWVHVYSDASDYIQIAGSIGDGDFNPRLIRKFSELNDPETGKTLEQLGVGPDVEIFVTDGHSGLLNDRAGFHRLEPILRIIEHRHGRGELLGQSAEALHV